MWAAAADAPEDGDARCERLLAQYERQLAELETLHFTPPWDGEEGRCASTCACVRGRGR